MKRALKIAGIVGGVVVVLLLGLFVLARLVITPERIRQSVIPLAEKALHRKVQLGEVQVSLFSGIVVKQLTVMEREGTQPFISAGELNLRYQFWPLLKKRVVVDEVRLVAPRIRVVKLPDGSFNYSDLTAKKEQPPPEEKPHDAGVDLLVTRVELTKGEVLYDDRSKPSGKPFLITVSGIEFTASDIAPDRQFPFKLAARLPGMALELEGKLADLKGKPSVDAQFQLKEGDLKQMLAGLPPELAAKATPYQPSGTVKARLHLIGALATPKVLPAEGELELAKVQLVAGGQAVVLAGKLLFNRGALKTDNFTVSRGGTTLQVAVAVANVFARPVVVNSTVSADRFELVSAGRGEPAPTAAVAQPEPKPLNLPVQATGTIQVGQALYKGLAIDRLTAKYRLSDNVLSIDQLSGNLAGGSFTDTARVDLSRPGYVYSTRLKVQGAQADPLVSAFAPKAKGTVYGTISLNADVSGTGIRTASLQKNLTGSGNFTVAEGRLTGMTLLQKLAQFVNLDQLRDIRFNKFAGTFRISGGKILLDSDVSGKDLQLTPRGTVGLDKSLDLSLVTKVSPELTGKVARGEVGRFLTDEKGWGVLPVKVAGTTASPKFRLDASVVREQLKGKAREKLQQTIEEKFLKKKEGEPQRPERELLEKGLKGIFGK